MLLDPLVAECCVTIFGVTNPCILYQKVMSICLFSLLPLLVVLKYVFCCNRSSFVKVSKSSEPHSLSFYFARRASNGRTGFKTPITKTRQHQQKPSTMSNAQSNDALEHDNENHPDSPEPQQDFEGDFISLDKMDEDVDEGDPSSSRQTNGQPSRSNDSQIDLPPWMDRRTDYRRVNPLVDGGAS